MTIVVVFLRSQLKAALFQQNDEMNKSRTQEKKLQILISKWRKLKCMDGVCLGPPYNVGF